MSAKKRRQEIFEVLKEVGAAIVKTFGDSCEVVLHDLTQLDSSIIWICGSVTGREIGGPLTDLGLARLRAGDVSPLYSYTTYTEDGKALKSSSIFLVDRDGKPFGALCINFDLSALLACEGALCKATARENIDDVKGTFSRGVSDMLAAMVMESVAEIGKPIELMQMADKVRLVAILDLDRKGAFHLRKAVPFLASRLGVSRYTVYNYLKQARREAG